jgi:hypothetical protein
MDINSYITLSAHAPKAGPRQLPPPEHVESVKSIPREITGLKRKYLEALQKNLSARNEYTILVQHDYIEDLAPTPANVHVTRLSEHVELLRLKKRHEELRILQRYLTKLKQTDSARTDFLDQKRPRGCEQGLALPVYYHGTGDNAQSDESVVALVRRLEIAVICAKHQADRERQLLTQVEKNVDLPSTPMTQRNRSRALAATRNELVAWMDSKLSQSPSNENYTEDDLLHEEQTLSPTRQLQSEITDKYLSYLDMRKRMIGMAAKIATTNQQPPAEISAPESKSVLLDSPIQSPVTSLLPFILKQIHHPKQNHQFHRQQTSHITILTNKERNKTITEISRLADESHLLPTYPTLTSQDRSKHSAAAHASVSLPRHVMARATKNEMSSRLNAWSFATHASRETTNEFVAGHLGKGEEAVEEGHEWLGMLKELVGEDEDIRHDEAEAEDRDHDEDEDVWALEAEAGLSKQAKQARSEAKGPWAGLLGNVGLKRHGKIHE